MMDQLISVGRFAKRNDCLKYLYKYMTKNYGIVWEQEHKDYVAQKGTVRQHWISYMEKIFIDQSLNLYYMILFLNQKRKKMNV